MPVVPVGEKLSAVYLDPFKPAENVIYRLSVLHTSAIATEYHWIDVSSKNIKGSYQCIQGVCCQAFGRRNQAYNVPIYVYRDPTRSTEGEVQVWRMTPVQWKKFSDMATQVNLLEYDLSFTVTKRGRGLDPAYTAVPDVKLRQYWTPEQVEQLKLAVSSFYQLGEASLVNPMALNDWNQLLYDCGYDLRNQCWPGGQSPMSQGQARGAIGYAVGTALPPAPPMGGPPAGFTPVLPAIPRAFPQGQVGGTILQPPSVQAGVVGTVPMGASPYAGFPPNTQTVSMPIQSSVSVGSGMVPQSTPVLGMGGIPPMSIPTPQQGLGSVSSPPFGAQPAPVGASFGGVPLGTAPVMPSPASPPTNSGVLGVAPQNEIPGTVEITTEEMDHLLE